MKLIAIILIVGLGLVGGCSNDDNPASQANSAPIIRSLSATLQEICRTEDTDLKAVVTDDDLDAISFDWSCNGGTFRYLHGTTAGWISPVDPGIYYVVLLVSDGKDIDRDSAAITVTSDWPNIPPTIPYSPAPGNGGYIGRDKTSQNLYWNCTDADGDSLYFDVYFGVESLNSLIFIRHDLLLKGIEATDLVPNTQYVWKVVVRDGHGSERTGPVWSFYTR